MQSALEAFDTTIGLCRDRGMADYLKSGMYINCKEKRCYYLMYGIINSLCHCELDRRATRCYGVIMAV